MQCDTQFCSDACIDRDPLFPGQVCLCAGVKAVVSSLMPDAEMSEDINVRVAGQATSSGLLVFNSLCVMRGRIALL